ATAAMHGSWSYRSERRCRAGVKSASWAYAVNEGGCCAMWRRRRRPCREVPAREIGLSLASQLSEVEQGRRRQRAHVLVDVAAELERRAANEAPADRRADAEARVRPL